MLNNNYAKNSIIKSAIVTGSNGFLGSWLVKELVNQQVEVYAVVRNAFSDISRLPSADCVHIVYCDSNNIKALSNILKHIEIDCFFDLAWEGSTGVDRGNHKMQLKNVDNCVNSVETACTLGCRRYIGAGSIAENDCYFSIMEPGTKPSIASCYGAAKIASHYMSKALCSEKGIEHIWACLPNTYGIGNRTQNFVNFAARLMLNGHRAAFTSGEQYYEFVYASDTAKGLFAIANQGHPSRAYYIGGKPRKLKEYIIDIRNAINPDIKLYLGEIPYQGAVQPIETFDSSLLYKDTGFECSVPFNQGISMTIPWLKENLT